MVGCGRGVGPEDDVTIGIGVQPDEQCPVVELCTWVLVENESFCMATAGCMPTCNCAPDSLFPLAWNSVM